MSKKVLGFTSRKWVAFWWGLIWGVVIGGLAVSQPPAATRRGVCGGRKNPFGGRENPFGGRAGRLGGFEEKL